MHLTNESQTLVGSITASDTPYGLLLTPNLAKASSRSNVWSSWTSRAYQSKLR